MWQNIRSQYLKRYEDILKICACKTAVPHLRKTWNCKRKIANRKKQKNISPAQCLLPVYQIYKYSQKSQTIIPNGSCWIKALHVVDTQVQVQDPDEAENGAVTLALQMGTPRLDFRLNSSTGVLFSTVVLDRERIAQYQLRLVAFDAGQYPRTSTSTITITGTIQNECRILSDTAGEDISSSNRVR